MRKALASFICFWEAFPWLTCLVPERPPGSQPKAWWQDPQTPLPGIARQTQNQGPGFPLRSPLEPYAASRWQAQGPANWAPESVNGAAILPRGFARVWRDGRTFPSPAFGANKIPAMAKPESRSALFRWSTAVRRGSSARPCNPSYSRNRRGFESLVGNSQASRGKHLAMQACILKGWIVRAPGSAVHRLPCYPQVLFHAGKLGARLRWSKSGPPSTLRSLA